MNPYQFTPQAADDLFEIWSYIARDNVEAANHLEDEVYKSCAFLAEGPLRGTMREDITDLPLRFWTVQAFPNYIIVYDPIRKPLQIIRILHGSRDILAILGEAHPKGETSPEHGPRRLIQSIFITHGTAFMVDSRAMAFDLSPEAGSVKGLNQ